MSSADCLAMLKGREDLLVNRRESPAKVEKLKKVRLAIAALEGRLPTRSPSRSRSRSRGRRRRRRSRSRSSNAPPWETEDDRWLRKQNEKMVREMEAIHKQQQQIDRDDLDRLRQRFR